MGCPAATPSPARTRGATGSYVVRSPPACSTLTTPVPATTPANATTPAPAERTTSPGVPARSTPRCPASQGRGGGAKPRVTTGAPATGHPYPATASSARPAGPVRPESGSERGPGTEPSPGPGSERASSGTDGSSRSAARMSARYVMPASLDRRRPSGQPWSRSAVDGEGGCGRRADQPGVVVAPARDSRASDPDGRFAAPACVRRHRDPGKPPCPRFSRRRTMESWKTGTFCATRYW
jgi:hypothetical protein